MRMVQKLLSSFALLLVLPTCWIEFVTAVDLCSNGYQAYSSQYAFLISSYASIVPGYVTDPDSAASYKSNIKPTPHADNPRACARQCCLWEACTMMVFDTMQKSCTLVSCSVPMLQNGLCQPQLDEVNTNKFSAQSLLTNNSNSQIERTSNENDDGSEESDVLDMIGGVDTPQRFVTVYLRLRSSLMKAYLDELRSLASAFPLSNFLNSSSASSQILINSLINRANKNGVNFTSASKPSTAGTFVQPCESNDDCTDNEICEYPNVSSSSGQSVEDSASSDDDDDYSDSSDYDSDSDYDYDDSESYVYRSKRHASEPSSISDSKMRSMISSLESEYENVADDDDAGVCVCSIGYIRVNATSYSAGVCVVDPNFNSTTLAASSKNSHGHGRGHGHGHGHQPSGNDTDTPIEVVVEDDSAPLLFGILDASMEGTNLVVIMVMVVIGILGLLSITWLCVACKVRIGKCCKACCDQVSAQRDETVRNTRANSSVGINLQRGDYRALMTSEAEADAMGDYDEDDEDVSFERSSLKLAKGSKSATTIDLDMRSRRNDSEKKK